MGNPDHAFGLVVGDRIELVSMTNDPLPMEPGSQGTVRGFCEGSGLDQVWVEWDPEVGRSLCLIPGVDRWRKL